MKAHFFDKQGNFVMTKELSDYNNAPIWREAEIPQSIKPYIDNASPKYIPEVMSCKIIEYRRTATLYNGSVIFEEKWD
jgi:hypothetical protein